MIDRRTVLKMIGLAALSGVSNSSIAQPPNFFDHHPSNEPKWSELVFTIEHSESLIDFSSHRSANYRVEVERVDGRTVVFRTGVAQLMPRPLDAYPYPGSGPELTPYLKPSRYIESTDPRIVALADAILDTAQIATAHDLVLRVLRWNRGHLSWGDPAGLPSATDAFETRSVNCIGFTHLPAALLRHLGIPARTVRTFKAATGAGGGALVPHYLLEVYYPSLGDWVTFDPQSGPPSPSNIALYTHHDWDFAGQRRTRPLVSDPRVRVWTGE
jgi:transglutaminase-like putative cysteine protease